MPVAKYQMLSLSVKHAQGIRTLTEFQRALHGLGLDFGTQD